MTIQEGLTRQNERLRLLLSLTNKITLSGQGPEGHYGLPGMRERGNLIGGKLVIWGEVGAGTEVELIVPASSAYNTARTGSWLSRKLAGKE